MRAHTIHEQQRLRLLAGALIARHYRRPLTLAGVARALSSSPRQLQRAYTRFDCSFSEDLLAVRMSAAAQLLVEQPSIPVADVARLVGYSRATHFARAFRRRFGLTPAVFRERERSERSGPRPRPRALA
jgi:AraC family transcriptional regulator, positive regulator of tynA and feaB